MDHNTPSTGLERSPRRLRIPCFAIEIRLGARDPDCPRRYVAGTITSRLKEPCPLCGHAECVADCTANAAERRECNRAMDGIEAVVLAAACAGVDVGTTAFAEAVETAVEACAGNL